MTLRGTTDKLRTPENVVETAPRPAWQAAQVTTLAEQLFDHEQDTPTHRKRSRPLASARLLGDLEGLTDRLPYGFGLDPFGQSLVHGPAAQARQRVVLGHAGSVGVTELRPHLLPERCKPHRARVPGGRPGPGPAAPGVITPNGNSSSTQRSLSNPGATTKPGPRMSTELPGNSQRQKLLAQKLLRRELR